jgi:hypothetical protein
MASPPTQQQQQRQARPDSHTVAKAHSSRFIYLYARMILSLAYELGKTVQDGQHKAEREHRTLIGIGVGASPKQPRRTSWC